MLLVECLRNIRTTFACGHSGSAKPFSLLKTVTEDRHTPENVEGLPVHQLRVRLCLRKRSDGKREQVQVQGWRERGICMMRSVLVSVGYGLLLHGAVELSPPPSHQDSKSCMKLHMFHMVAPNTFLQWVPNNAIVRNGPQLLKLDVSGSILSKYFFTRPY